MLENFSLEGPILILSPHLDDAVLSVGGLMDLAIKKGLRVVAGTIFTADAPDCVASSATVQELHALWGLGPNPHRIRRQEDIVSVEYLGAEYLHGDLLDSPYRTDREGGFLYPSRRQIFSTPSPIDPIQPSLQALIRSWIADINPAVILCPLGVGRHVDHVSTSEALRALEISATARVYLYEDLPYSAGFFPPDPSSPDTVLKGLERTGWTIGGAATIAVDADRKIAAIMKYESQINDIFPGGLDVEDQLKRFMITDDKRGYQERLWSVR